MLIKQTLKKWFTLVELIVVITILAVLGTIAFVSFQKGWEKAEKVATKTALQSYASALNFYKQEAGFLPKITKSNWEDDLPNWKIGYLTSKSSLAAKLEWAKTDTAWKYVINGDPVYYAVDASWQYYALWAKYKENGSDKVMIETNYPIDSRKATLFWKYDWTNWTTFIDWSDWPNSSSTAIQNDIDSGISDVVGLAYAIKQADGTTRLYLSKPYPSLVTNPAMTVVAWTAIADTVYETSDSTLTVDSDIIIKNTDNSSFTPIDLTIKVQGTSF